MTLDHKAAYLNAHMVGHIVKMSLTKEVAGLLCGMAQKHSKFLRPDGTIVVKLRKALYGCIEISGFMVQGAQFNITEFRL